MLTNNLPTTNQRARIVLPSTHPFNALALWRDRQAKSRGVCVELARGLSLYTGEIKQGGIFASLNPNVLPAGPN
jgi:hypothetical protein